MTFVLLRKYLSQYGITTRSRKIFLNNLPKCLGILYRLRVQNLAHGRLIRGADKSLARPTSRCILFDGENISFDAYLLTYLLHGAESFLRS